MFLVINFRYIYKNIDLPWIKGKTGAQHRKVESSEEKKNTRIWNLICDRGHCR